MYVPQTACSISYHGATNRKACAMSRRQLPPQIKKIEVTDRKTGKTIVRYQVTVDTGQDPQTGKRRQVRRRYTTEKEARDALSEIGDQAAKDIFVPRSVLTVKQFCED